jgi:dihydroxyacetone kinase phosphoprotein-dependent L subunit
VSGGGSGHEPMHGGFVGPGMLDAPGPGEVFTSPTPDQMMEATKAVDGGAGVLHIVKNYTGDVMNFDMAADLAKGDGVEVEAVVTNDDVAVQDSLYAAGRRGVGITVIAEKICGAAAEERRPLAEVAELCRSVNGAGRSMGMALTPCTTPSAGEPSFQLTDDEMEIGIGIHGEPGDHGTNMDRGMHKALEKLDTLDGDDIGATLQAVGMTLVSSVGGAAGPLYGTLFLQMGTATTGATTLDVAGFAGALEAGVKGVQARGKSEPGDKTMVDALLPAVAASRNAAAGGDANPEQAVREAAAAAEGGMKATIPMEARKGRASYLGPRSVGHQDPGATSSYLLLRSAGEAFASS